MVWSSWSIFASAARRWCDPLRLGTGCRARRCSRWASRVWLPRGRAAKATTTVADCMRHQPGRSFGVHHFLAAGGVLHQQAQELAGLLDDTHVGDTGFVAGGGVFQVRDDPPHSVEGGGDAALPDSGAWQGGRENGEAVDRVDIGERHGIVHDSHISRNAALARCNRDFTVPAGIPRVVAISCSLRPSRVRNTSTTRWETGSRARASSMSTSPSGRGGVAVKEALAPRRVPGQARGRGGSPSER